MYIQGSPVEIQTPKFWNPIFLSITAQRPVLSPSSTLPSHSALIAAGKIRRKFKKNTF
jgi:hypothetical protein